MTRLLRRHRLWLVPGLALALVANAQANQQGLGLVPVILFGILPHLPVLLGIRQPRPRGHIGTQAVPLFNALHQPLVPAVIAGLGLAGLLSPLALVAGLAWLGHIVVDWGLGDGLRMADGGHRPAAAGWRLQNGLPPAAASSRLAGG
jgi:hypothetical protein